MDWGDALRLAGEATRDAERAGLRTEALASDFFAQAIDAFEVAMRCDPEGCGEEAGRLAAACEDAMYDEGRGGRGPPRSDAPPSPFPPYEPWR